MILNFLKNVLVTDVNNLFEDVSVIEHLNDYEKNTTADRKLTIRVKGVPDNQYSLNTEKPINVNKVLNTIISREKNYFLSSSKVKFVGKSVFIDLQSENDKKKVTFIVESGETSLVWKNPIVGDISHMGALKGVKFVKSYQSRYLYVFFEQAYLKLDVLSIKIFM